MNSVRILTQFLSILTACFTTLVGTGSVETSAQELLGRTETVFESADFSCPGDRPDIPASAFRRDDGVVVLIAGNRKNIVSTGPTLAQQSRRDCVSLLIGGGDPDPSRFDDQKWVTQLFSFNGRDVTAFVHHEYHGELHGENCRIRPIGDRQCWYASTVKAVSNDGGYVFQNPPLDEKVIIAPPSLYVSGKRRVGTFLPKVVSHPSGRFAYMLVSSADRNAGIGIGQCLLRSSDPTMKKWELWTGRNWRKAAENPYKSGGNDGRYCSPVVAGNILSLRYVPQLNEFIIVNATHKGVYLRYSTDMINWGPRRRIRGIRPSDGNRGEGASRGFPHKRWYFSLLDPLSKSRNFDTVSLTPYLYYVEFGNKGDNSLRVRALKRVQISIEK